MNNHLPEKEHPDQYHGGIALGLGLGRSVIKFYFIYWFQHNLLSTVHLIETDLLHWVVFEWIFLLPLATAPLRLSVVIIVIVCSSASLGTVEEAADHDYDEIDAEDG